MMEVSSNSSSNMEGIEGFNQGGVAQSYNLEGSTVCSADTISAAPSSSVNYCLVEESMEPSPADCAAYEQYLHLPELRAMWKAREWPGWPNEQLLKPALQSLEITFRFISAVLCDSRPYVDKSEWARRLESLAGSQLELISMILEEDRCAPTVQLSVGTGVLATRVTQEVWQRPGASPVVSRTSQESLLPRLGTWKRAEDMVARIWLAIECHMQRVPFTLGLGEPNLSGKPILEYDRTCKPTYLHSFKQSAQFNNGEVHTLCAVHQILEAWLFVAQEMLKRIHERVNRGDPAGASRDCWMVEKMWNLITDAENLLLLMDPDDFLRLRYQLAINGTGIPSGAAYCLRSHALRDVTNACEELRHLVPKAMGVQADPKGGPRLQEAVMHLFHSHGRLVPDGTCGPATIHLLQAFQAVEAAVKRFFFSYQQLVIVVMGSVEMKGSVYLSGASDALSQIYLEPPYFPSVDGAKTFLSDYWHYGPTTATTTILRRPAAQSGEPRCRTVQPTIP